MAAHASVALGKNGFVATLGDGRQIERPDFREMALALHCAGIKAGNVQFDWQPGQRMITAGQQVALRAEMRRLKQEAGALAIAA